jgi:hypothetical protein
MEEEGNIERVELRRIQQESAQNEKSAQKEDSTHLEE